MLDFSNRWDDVERVSDILLSDFYIIDSYYICDSYKNKYNEQILLVDVSGFDSDDHFSVFPMFRKIQPILICSKMTKISKIRRNIFFVLQDHLRFRLIKSLFSHPKLLIIFCQSNHGATHYCFRETAGPACWYDKPACWWVSL